MDEQRHVMEVRSLVVEWPDNGGPGAVFEVLNHPTDARKFVVHCTGARYVFGADEFRRAIDNAQNGHSWKHQAGCGDMED